MLMCTARFDFKSFKKKKKEKKRLFENAMTIKCIKIFVYFMCWFIVSEILFSFRCFPEVAMVT